MDVWTSFPLNKSLCSTKYQTFTAIYTQLYNKETLLGQDCLHICSNPRAPKVNNSSIGNYNAPALHHFWQNTNNESIAPQLKMSMTRFQLILPVDKVTKNLTGHRMHVAGPQNAKLTAGTIAFRICMVCYRQQLTAWPGKSILQKKTTIMAILVCTNLSYLTLERPGRQTVDTKSTFGVPPKTWGITLHTNYV